MKTLNHDAEDRRSYGWDGAAFTVTTVPTPSDIKRLDEINQAYAARQAEDDARNAHKFDQAFELIARHYPQAA